MTLLCRGTRITGTLVVDRLFGEGAFASLEQTRALLDAARPARLAAHAAVVALISVVAIRDTVVEVRAKRGGR